MQTASGRTLRREIDEAIVAGKTLEEIDVEILAPCELGEEASAVLWLYAYGCLDRAAAGHLPQITPSVSEPLAPT